MGSKGQNESFEIFLQECHWKKIQNQMFETLRFLKIPDYWFCKLAHRFKIKIPKLLDNLF